MSGQAPQIASARCSESSDSELCRASLSFAERGLLTLLRVNVLACRRAGPLFIDETKDPDHMCIFSVPHSDISLLRRWENLVPVVRRTRRSAYGQEFRWCFVIRFLGLGFLTRFTRHVGYYSLLQGEQRAAITLNSVIAPVAAGRRAASLSSRYHRSLFGHVLLTLTDTTHCRPRSPHGAAAERAPRSLARTHLFEIRS